jgi:hypothetical protein
VDAWQLGEIEAIKQLKARYFRLMDQKRWDEFAELFSADCEQEWRASPESAPQGHRGRDAVVAFIRASLEGLESTHHGHDPEIAITGATTATGIWALFDHCTRAGVVVFRGAGWYEDDYVKEGGAWKICRTRLRARPF